MEKIRSLTIGDLLTLLFVAACGVAALAVLFGLAFYWSSLTATVISGSWSWADFAYGLCIGIGISVAAVVALRLVIWLLDQAV